MATSQKFIPPTYGPDVLARQLQMQQDAERAKMQMQQGMQSPQGQMVSGHYVAPSITQYLAQGLNAYLGREGMNKLPEQQAELQQMQQQQMLGQFGFGQPSPQQLARGLTGEQPQVGIDDGVPGFTPAQGGMQTQQGQGPMLLPGLNEQQSMAALQTLGPEEYMKQYAKQFSPTTLMQNIQAAGLQPGTPEYQQAMLQGTRTGTTVNVGQSEFGTIPPGYELFTDAQGGRSMRPIAGGPAAAEVAAAAQTQAEADAYQDRFVSAVVQDSNRAIDLIESGDFVIPPYGISGMLSSAVPGTKSHELKRLIDSMEASVSIENLNAMRRASPTGGALGNVSEKQLAVLGRAFGELNQSQSRDMLTDNLKRVHNIFLDIAHGVGEGPQRHMVSFDNQGRRVEGGAPWNPMWSPAEDQSAQQAGQAQQQPKNRTPVRTGRSADGRRVVQYSDGSIEYSE